MNKARRASEDSMEFGVIVSVTKDELGQPAVRLQKEEGDTYEDLRAYAAGATDRLIKGTAPREELNGIRRSEVKIQAIEKLIGEVGFAPLSIPDNGKSLLRARCMRELPHLFVTEGQFDEAWKTACRLGRVQMYNRDKFVGR